MLTSWTKEFFGLIKNETAVGVLGLLQAHKNVPPQQVDEFGPCGSLQRIRAWHGPVKDMCLSLAREAGVNCSPEVSIQARSLLRAATSAAAPVWMAPRGQTLGIFGSEVMTSSVGGPLNYKSKYCSQQYRVFGSKREQQRRYCQG